MTGPENQSDLLGLHAMGKLDATQEAELFHRAAKDQELFDALVHEEVLRNLLSEPGVRQDLIRHLELTTPLPETPPGKWRTWLRGWRGPSLVLAVTCAIVLLVNVPRRGETDADFMVPLSGGVPETTFSPSTVPKSLELDSLPPISNSSGAATVSLDRGGLEPVYAVGDSMRIGIRAITDCSVQLVELRDDGSRVEYFPNQFIASSELRAGQTTFIPPEGQGDLRVEGPAGLRRLQLWIGPVGANPSNPAVRDRVILVERRYRVK